jgi:hypothetical protein
VLTAPGRPWRLDPDIGEVIEEQQAGHGWYRVSAPRAGWVDADFVSTPDIDERIGPSACTSPAAFGASARLEPDGPWPSGLGRAVPTNFVWRLPDTGLQPVSQTEGEAARTLGGRRPGQRPGQGPASALGAAPGASRRET